MESKKSSVESGGAGRTAEREPILVSIRPTLLCNFSCTNCLSSSGMMRKEKAEWSELEKFFAQLDEAKFRGDLHICGGEPFVYDQIDRLIVESSRHAPSLAILTNASWVPAHLNEHNRARLEARLLMVRGLPNTMLRLSIDTYHFEGEHGRTTGMDRLRIFVEVAGRLGLEPDVDYQVMVTESTVERALEMKRKITEYLGVPEPADFIRTRGVYRLGRSSEGKVFALGEPGYIAVNPKVGGKLVIHPGRTEETMDVVYGPVERLAELIESQRKAIALRRQ